MRKTFLMTLSVTGVAIVIAARAQGPAQGQAQGPSPRPMIAESMPVVADLAKSIRFYHDLLGLQGRGGDPRAAGWYPTFPFLEDMYGGVGGQLQNVIFLIPGSDLQFEPIQWQNAKGKALNPRLQDTGASLTIFHTRNIDKLTGYLKQGGAKVVTSGGEPVTLTDAEGMSRSIVFEDGNGFFVELIQPAVLPAGRGGGPGGNAPRQFIYGADVTVTVNDLDKSARFLREVLGVNVMPSQAAETKKLALFGMKTGQYREADVAWPDNTPKLRLIQFTGIEQKTLMPLVADPNANLIRLFVRDMDSTLAKVKAFPEAKIMNVSGVPTTPEMRPDHTPWLVVRLPGGSTYLQIVGVENGRVG